MRIGMEISRAIMSGCNLGLPPRSLAVTPPLNIKCWFEHAFHDFLITDAATTQIYTQSYTLSFNVTHPI
jgi:hypothetical protein